MSTDIEQLARKSIEDFNRSDWAAIEATVAPGYTYDETGTGAHLGAADLIPYLQAWKSALPDATGEITGVVTNGDTAVVAVTWRGTQTGTLQLPTGPFPPTGRQIDGRAVLWQRWDGDKLAAEWHYLDMLTLLTQLGVIPAAQPA